MRIKTEVALNFLKVIILFLFVLNLSVVYAQRDTIYVDENGKSISKKVFANKMNSSIYYGMRYSGDSLVLQEINYRYRFGQLMPIPKSQLFKLLNKRHGIDTTKTLVIHYIDTLLAKSKFPKHNKIVSYDSLGHEIKNPIKSHRISDGVVFDLNNLRKVAKHVHVQNHRSFIKSYKSCVRKFKKLKNDNVLFHFYNYNEGHPNEVKQVKWYQDHGGLLKKMFVQGKNQFNSLIIKPSGEFFVEYKESYKIQYYILESEGWDKIKNDFETQYSGLNNIDI
ncbi:hypothetical protein ACFSKN_05800 [Mariniflexile gromovii]|uniref:DKNYY family protein n=1 Tax=Mariniflexile gromovii TaxID=362523 RepID=A0ABS4BX26_9FLAO|nr:hypothetical protein [Mariniflexile gromovii]MBP0905146.1 hypothetical protein [Mariniflexile gromovii]